jgi:hypothetical protein
LKKKARMNTEDILKKLPSGGLLKTTDTKGAAKTAPLDREKRAALIRKGNELFNEGDYGFAQRIFVTTRYSDGMIRLGDTFATGGTPLDALRLYWLSRQRLTSGRQWSKK